MGSPRSISGHFICSHSPPCPQPPELVPSGPADLSQQMEEEGRDETGTGMSASARTCQGWGP